jgi:hypothetical protein
MASQIFDRIRRELARKNRVRDEAEVEAPADAISIDQLPTSRIEAVAPPRETISLVPAPVSRITGKGPHGALPVVAKDGTRAAKLYARPVPQNSCSPTCQRLPCSLGAWASTQN